MSPCVFTRGTEALCQYLWTMVEAGATGSLFKGMVWAGEMAQMVKYLPQKHEDMSSIPQNPSKNPDTVVCASQPRQDLSQRQADPGS